MTRPSESSYNPTEVPCWRFQPHEPHNGCPGTEVLRPHKFTAGQPYPADDYYRCCERANADPIHVAQNTPTGKVRLRSVGEVAPDPEQVWLRELFSVDLIPTADAYSREEFGEREAYGWNACREYVLDLIRPVVTPAANGPYTTTEEQR